MPISLPAGLSKPLVDFAAQEADKGETCEFEAGEDRRAPISTTAPTSVEVRWHMTQDQFDLFDVWFEELLLAGSLSFNLPAPIQGGTLTELQEAMFLEPPECTYVHKDNWEVSAKCVVGIAGLGGVGGEEGGDFWSVTDINPAGTWTGATSAIACTAWANAVIAHKDYSGVVIDAEACVITFEGNTIEIGNPVFNDV